MKNNCSFVRSPAVSSRHIKVKGRTKVEQGRITERTGLPNYDADDFNDKTDNEFIKNPLINALGDKESG